MTILDRLDSNWSREEREKLNNNWTIIESYLSNLQGQINFLTGNVNVQELIDQLKSLLSQGTIILDELKSVLINVEEIIVDAKNATNDANDAAQSALNAVNDIQSMLDNFQVRGTYDNDTVYSKNNSVFYEGSSYIYTNNTPGKGNPPPNYPAVSNEHWQMTAAKGAAGDGAVSKVNGKEPDGAGEVTLTASDVGAASAEQLEQMKPKVDNSWQKGVYNDTDIINLGNSTAEKVLVVNQSSWKNTGNVEQLDIIIPVGGAFSGLIKVTYTSFWGGSDSHGGATVLYRIGNYTNAGTGTRLNDYVLETITPAFAKDYYIHQPFIDENNGTIILLLSKAPSANNPLIAKIEFQGYNFGQKSAFQIMNETNFAIYDNGSPTHNGYPWTPQVSRIPTGAQTRFWDTSMWNDIIDGRTFTFAGGTHNVANFTPEQFRNVLDSYLVNKMGTFKCLLPSSGLGLTNLMDMYGILTTIKPWTDESGGGLKQRFETSDIIFKRYQIDATTWSPWVCIQSKDVDIIKLFQSASDVKKNVAQAITDKGVQTSPDATGAQMATNIRAIQSGKRTLDTYLQFPPGGANSDIIVDSNEIDFEPKNISVGRIGASYVGGIWYPMPKIQNMTLITDIRVVQVGAKWKIRVTLHNGYPTQFYGEGVTLFASE